MNKKTGRKALKRSSETLYKYFKKHWLLYVLLVPMILYMLLFAYYPMTGLQIAFKDWKLTRGIWGSPWATTNGHIDIFKHFRTLFSEDLFFIKFCNTIRISILNLLIGFPIPIIMTIFLNEMKSEGYKRTVQTVSYLPYFISWVIISGIVFTMTETGSPLQIFFKAIFGKEIYFFSDNNLFLGVIVASGIWKGAGWGTIIYFAAISNVDLTLYEAAEVDGANRWKKIIYITLPGLMPAFTINLIFALAGITGGNFDQIYNFYNSAVYDKGDILDTYLFRIGIGGGKYDVATALGFFNSLIGFTLTIVANKIIKVLGGDGIW